MADIENEETKHKTYDDMKQIHPWMKKQLNVLSKQIYVYIFIVIVLLSQSKVSLP